MLTFYNNLWEDKYVAHLKDAQENLSNLLNVTQLIGSKVRTVRKQSNLKVATFTTMLGANR